MSRIMVLAVHPDDESLGCGGTLFKHKSNGDDIFWVIATCMTENGGFCKKDILRRDCEIKAVAEMYKFDGVYNLGIPAKAVDKLEMGTLIGMISDVFNEVQPDTLYLPFIGDIHSDHRVIVEAAQSCTKTFRYPFIKKILMMETISETEFAVSSAGAVFAPNYFIDISDFIDKKLDVVKIYKSELGEQPFPRNLKNIRALATFRGAASGCKYAESFMIVKEIW